MAFVRNKTHASLAATASSITGTMPSYEPGDLLFAFAISDGNLPITVNGAWTVLEQGNGLATVGYSVAYIENATGSETAPVFTLSGSDTATAIVLAIGGVPTSSTIEASTTPVQLTLVRSESPFTGVTTLTDNAFVLHLFGNTGVGGCATDQGLLRVSDEIGYIGESAFILEETLPNAGASSSGNMLQFGNALNFYMSLSIADGSSGSEVKPQQIGGGMELINALQGAENVTWLIGGNPTLITPSDVTTPADYGTILGKSFITVEAAADVQDSNTNPFIAAAKFVIDRGEFYSGLRFGMDRQGTGGSLDMTGKAVIATIHLANLASAVKYQTKDAIGLGIVLESGADDYDNYIAHAVSGSDAKSPKVTPLNGPCVLNHDYGSAIASSGTFDETDLLKISVIAASLNTPNLNIYMCNIGLLSAFEIVGGSSSIPINQSYLYDVGYANLAYLIQNTGDLILSYAPWKFGNSVIDTYVNFAGKTFSFPEQGADTGALVNDTFLGLTFDSTASSDINCQGMTLASPTPFYLDVVNALGAINFTNTTITNSQTCNLRGDFTGASFTPKAGTVINDFDAIINDITVNGDLRLNTERDLSGVTATKVVFTQGGSYIFSGCDILEVENISGSPVTITSDAAIPTVTETNGTITAIDSLLSFSGVDAWEVYANSIDQNASTNQLGSGTSSDNYLFTFDGTGTTIYYLRLLIGQTTLLKSITPISTGETEVSLTTTDLLVALDEKFSSIETKDEADIRQLTLIAEHDETLAAVNAISFDDTAILNSINALNDIDTAQIRIELATELARLDVAVSSISAGGSYDDTALIAKVDIIDANVDAIKVKTNTLVNTDLTGIATTTNITDARDAVITEVNVNETKIDAIKAKTDQFSFTSGNVNAIAQVVTDKTGYSLTSAERTAIAVAVEQAILSESDGQAILNAIVGAIGNSNVDEIALVAAIRVDLERTGGIIDNLPTLSEIEASSILSKEDSVQLSIAVSA